MDTGRFVCIHGHFYQPPRENPWLELVEQQDSAYPYHDWNERITAECYGPNAAARILDDEGRIAAVVDNYERISFNVGPTLLDWMQDREPELHDAIVDADDASAARYGGHGSAIAQVYNHIIMPLATTRDRRTQIRWGIADFRHRFGRDPEGMWLAETAVDTETLELLAEEGIAYTILSPYQAARTRGPGTKAWEDASGGDVDPTRPYRVALPSGRDLAVFFYDGPLARAVAFEGLLQSGERLADRIRAVFDGRDGPQLVHLATDGESYGHHHRHGEMALARALQLLAEDPGVELINYGAYLERFPPDHEAEIVEDSSWSCAHGIERWRSDCGCADGGHAGAAQDWRAPLRAALDWLRDELAPRFEVAAGELLADPWAARDDYIEVILDRRPTSIADFVERHARHDLGEAEVGRVLKLLEIQRQALLMFTSCGWFFDELSRIETVQVLAYAARALQLAGEVLPGPALDGELRERLAKAPSYADDLADGREVYERRVLPVVVSMRQVAAHAAVSGLFTRGGPPRRVGSYELERHGWHVSESGRASLGVGQVTVRSEVTQDRASFDVAVLHLGDHNIVCGVRQPASPGGHEELRTVLGDAFATADVPQVVRLIDAHLGPPTYSLRDLFRDEQRRILRDILDGVVTDAERAQRSIYRGRASLLRYLRELDVQLPSPLSDAAEVTLNADLRDQFAHGEVDVARVRALIEEAERLGVALDEPGLAHTLSHSIRTRADRISEQLDEPGLFDRFGDEEAAFFDQVEALVQLSREVRFDVELGPAQLVLYRVLQAQVPALRQRAVAGDEPAATWLARLRALAAELRVVFPDDEEGT